MMRFNFFKKSDTEVITIKNIDNHNSDWGGNGVVFYVKNGKGLLAMKYGYLENNALATLVFGDVPLIKSEIFSCIFHYIFSIFTSIALTIYNMD